VVHLHNRVLFNHKEYSYVIFKKKDRIGDHHSKQNNSSLCLGLFLIAISYQVLVAGYLQLPWLVSFSCPPVALSQKIDTLQDVALLYHSKLWGAIQWISSPMLAWFQEETSDQILVPDLRIMSTVGFSCSWLPIGCHQGCLYSSGLPHFCLLGFPTPFGS
jgi:hypothetical protein